MHDECEVIIPTFYPGEVIINLLNSIPKDYKIKIIDNGFDDELKKIILKSNLDIDHIELGDVGLGKSFNYALSNIKTKYAFITQPDVTLAKDCIKNLVKIANEFSNAAIISPLYFDNGIYSKFDFYDLKISKLKKIISNKKNKNLINSMPQGNICVEAINSTAILINVEKIKSVNGWDENFYTYLEDMDLCLRVRLRGFEIIKTPFASIDHKGFLSHRLENRESRNISRIWNFTWSSLYFTKKHRSKLFFFIYYWKLIIKILIKIFINFLFLNKKKIKIYQVRLSACISFFSKKNFSQSKYKKLL